MSGAEFALQQGASGRTVRKWLQQGELPTASKDGRGHWCIPSDAGPETAVALENRPGTTTSPVSATPPLSSSPTTPACSARLDNLEHEVQWLCRRIELASRALVPHG